MSHDCNISIENLGRPCPCGNNMSGVNTVYVTLKDHVSAINATNPEIIQTFADKVTIGSSAMTKKAIETKTAKGFVSIFSAKDLGELKYTPQGSIIGCKSMKANLEIFHPGFKRKLLGFSSTAMNEELIIIVKLNNGEYHLLGDIDRGAELADGSETTSGKATTDNNGATLMFSYDTPAPQIFYEGWNPNDETTGITFIEG